MESLVESINPFGRAQKLYCLIVGLVVSTTGSAFYTSVFYLAHPDLKCTKINDSMSATNGSNVCEMWQNVTLSRLQNESSPYKCEFSDEYYKLTLVNSLDLACDKEYLLSWTQTIYFLGSICSFINGILSDRYGRKKSCLYFMITYVVCHFLNQIIIADLLFKLDNWTKFLIYCVYQFAGGFMAYCIFSAAYVLLFEFTTESFHTILSNVFVYFFIFGEFVLMISFYFTRSYIVTNWILGVIAVISLILFGIFVPESPKFKHNCIFI